MSHDSGLDALRHGRSPRAARIAVAVALSLMALATPARSDGVPGQFSFTPPPGWAPSAEVREKLGTSVRAAFGYSLDSQRIFGVHLLVVADPGAGSVRQQSDAFARGIIDVLGTTRTVTNVTRTETGTTMDLVLDVNRDGAALRERCTIWVRRDRALHAVCGLCAAPAAVPDECADALASIHITAPDRERLPLASPGYVPRISEVYELGRRVGQLLVPLALLVASIAIVVYFVRRRPGP